MRYAGFIAAGAGIAVIGIGLWTVGSPLTARHQKLDQTRIAHLQTISDELAQYWQAKGILPQKLDELRDPLRNVTVPVDPETNQPYEYERGSDTSFKLCATFRQAAKEQESTSKNYGYLYYPPSPGSPQGNWAHPAGRQCFERTIDKDFFVNQKKLD